MKKYINNLIFSSGENLYSAGILAVRVAAGILMMTHGYAKMINFSQMASAFPDPLGVGSEVSLSLIIGSEFFASIFLILGLFTRLALVPLIFGMSVAAFIIHGSDPMQVKELAFVYLFIYISLIISGPGKFSLDRLLYTHSSLKTSPRTDK
jgi:putative oxidoreductase